MKSLPSNSSGASVMMMQTRAQGKSISRTYINFLNMMADQGVLCYHTEKVRGGPRRIYYPLMDERGYEMFVVPTLNESLMRDFSSDSREVLTDFL